MLRITPLSLAVCRFQHDGHKTATGGNREGCNFGEKDERRVNGEMWSYAGLTRVSINLQKNFSEMMDCRA